MTGRTHLIGVAAGALLLLDACSATRPPAPVVTPPPPPPAPAAAAAELDTRATIVAGTPRLPVAANAVRIDARAGDISLNFPAADVHVVAQTVLGDLLRLPYGVAAGVTAPVTLVTPRPIARGALLALFEDALRASNLALVRQNGSYVVQSIDQARGAGIVANPETTGFGSETIRLQFVSADEMRKLLDPVLPGVVTSIDSTGNALVIAGTTGQRRSARDLLSQFDVNWLRSMSFALLVPQRTDARLIVPELDKLINGPDAPTRGLVRILSMEKLNGILAVSAQRQYLDDVRRWVEILDREGENNERRLFVYRVQNGRSRDLAKTLNVAFGNSGAGGGAPSPAEEFGGLSNNNSDNPRRGGQETGRDPTAPPRAAAVAGEATAPAAGSGITASISSDETNNAIIVFGTPREYAVIEDALRKLDILPYQVLIEAAITEVTLNNDMRYGVQWNFQAGDTNFALTGPTNATATPSRLFPGFSFFFSNNNDISATLNALEGRTHINVISAPKLLVLNNQTAALQVGDQVPITTQSAVGVVDSSAPIVNSVEYRDTGVILKVTPRVNASGLVLLDISQEVSDVASTNTSNIDSPTIQTRRISTTIAVQDGQVIALGGLIRDRTEKGKSGLPLLSRLPLIGGLLFGNTTAAKDRTELLVLLKPRVLRTIDDGRAVTEELRAKIRTLEPFRSTGDIP